MSVKDFLVAHGCCFAGDRFSVILDFLKNAEVECSADFTGLCCIRLIDGADSLMKSEAEALQRVVDLVSRKGYRSRSVIDSGQSQLVERAVSAEPENKLRRIETHLRDTKEFDLALASKGPRAACTMLVDNLKRGLDRQDWVERARIAAIVGSCPKSHPSVISGLRFWAFFAIRVLNLRGDLLPPSLEGLLAWSRLFRSKGTFCNYVSYVKLGCEILNYPVGVFAHPSLKRAKEAILKRRLVEPRLQTWIGHELLVRLVRLGTSRSELHDLLMVFIAAYAFLLRVPSECLPMAAHSAPKGMEVPVFMLRGREAVLRLPFRKNRLFPTEIVRSCWCSSCKLTCPVHAFGAFMQNLPAGARPFASFNPGQTLLALRELLCELDVEHAMLYRMHDFRRGHAEDLRRLPGTTLGEILEAGDWSSGAFKDYLDRKSLERDRVAAAHGKGLLTPSTRVPSDSEGDSD